MVWQVSIPFYVMTSPLTHEQIVSYFAEKAFFGLPKDDVFFFSQGAVIHVMLHVVTAFHSDL